MSTDTELSMIDKIMGLAVADDIKADLIRDYLKVKASQGPAQTKAKAETKATTDPDRQRRFDLRYALRQHCQLLVRSDPVAAKREANRIKRQDRGAVGEWKRLHGIHFNTFVKPLYAAGRKQDAMITDYLWTVFNPRPGGVDWSLKLKRPGTCPHFGRFRQMCKPLLEIGLITRSDYDQVATNWWIEEQTEAQSVFRFAHESWAVRELLRRAGTESKAKRMLG